VLLVFVGPPVLINGKISEVANNKRKGISLNQTE
jgi:hypothetical protein